MGRAYCSPRGGLWVTLVVPFAAARPPADVLDGLGLRIGVACWECVRGVVGEEPAEGERAEVAVKMLRPVVALKWPNDVLIGEKKVLGVLTEVVVPRGRSSSSFLCLGVGMNANFGGGVLPEALRERATTLLDVIGRPVDLAAVEADLLGRLVGAALRRGLPESTLAAARGALHGVGEPVVIAVPGGSDVRGTLLGLDDRGFLRVRTADGEEAVGMAPLGA